MTVTQMTVNGKAVHLDVEPDMPLLWAVREELQLTGTKFGCGVAQCGACTVHLNGVAVRGCVTPVAAAQGGQITTIEAMAGDPIGAVVQAAWVEHDVAQCGYCQSGQVMTTVALLKKNKKPTDAEIDEALAGNLCRCGTYVRIRAAVHAAAAKLA
jgi:isoquinoline 1-oxidoreductase alpha subunit